MQRKTIEHCLLLTLSTLWSCVQCRTLQSHVQHTVASCYKGLLVGCLLAAPRIQLSFIADIGCAGAVLAVSQVSVQTLHKRCCPSRFTTHINCAITTL